VALLIFCEEEKCTSLNLIEYLAAETFQKTYWQFVATKTPKDKDVLIHYLVKNQL